MQANVYNIEKLGETLGDAAADIGLRILVAAAIYIVGRFAISKLLKAMTKLKGISRVDITAQTYIFNVTKTVLYVALAVTIVAELGVPMSSIIALLAALSATIGLAAQGALSNFAGGLMLLIFRPFSVGDYIVYGEDQGFVRSISLVYTIIRTFDNRIISIPNGALMNSRVVNTTAEKLRRADIRIDIASGEDPERVRAVMLETVAGFEEALREPEPEVAATDSVTDGVTYTLRVWTDTSDYWTVLEGLQEKVPAALDKAGIRRPAVPVRLRDNSKNGD